MSFVPRNSVFYSSMALIKMLILFDEIGKRVTIEKNDVDAIG